MIRGRLMAAAAACALAPLMSATPAAAGADNPIALSWSGGSYTTGVLDGSFIGQPRVVPGDERSRVVRIKNNSGERSRLRVSIVNVNTALPQKEDMCQLRNGHKSCLTEGYQGNFYEDLKLRWDMTPGYTSLAASPASFATLDKARNGVTRIYEVQMAPGEVANLDMGFFFPESATSGNRSNAGPLEAQFDVLVEMSGHAPAPSNKLVIKAFQKLVKDLDKDGYADAGDHILYTFKVTNDSSQPLHDIQVHSALLDQAGIAVRCDKAALAPQQSTMCRAVRAYVVTSADVKSGAVRLVATATGINPQNEEVVSNPDGVKAVPRDVPTREITKERDSKPRVQAGPGLTVIDSGSPWFSSPSPSVAVFSVVLSVGLLLIGYLKFREKRTA